MNKAVKNAGPGYPGNSSGPGRRDDGYNRPGVESMKQCCWKQPPPKRDVVKWVDEFLPESCSYVGLTPVLNHIYIHNEGYGIATAKADLFHDGMFGVVTPPQSNAQAVNFATEFIQLLGANPLFIDFQENDGLMAVTHLLPQLVSIALLNSTWITQVGRSPKSGWTSVRKQPGQLHIWMRLKHWNLL